MIRPSVITAEYQISSLIDPILSFTAPFSSYRAVNRVTGF